MMMISAFAAALFTLFATQSDPVEDPAAPPPMPAQAQGNVVVVELFTSQSCGMCPRANALLGELAGQEGYLALAYGVNYWDDFQGWKDQFAKAEFVSRQEDYVQAGEASRVYTPHFVINGSPRRLRFREGRIRRAVSEAQALPVMVSAIHDDGAIAVRLDGPVLADPAQVWRVDYHPGPIETDVEAGPNRGKEMNHFNMVDTITLLSDWSGGAETLSVGAGADGLASAILVQHGTGGPILTAAVID